MKKEEINKLDDNKISVIKEFLNVDINKSVTGEIKIHKSVVETPVNKSFDLESTSYNIQKVERNEFVDEMPQVQYLENKTIIPVLKEVLVKRVLLVEEIHIEKVTTTNPQEVNETLREEKIDIERNKH